MSSHLVWSIIRNNNAFLVKKRNISKPFSTVSHWAKSSRARLSHGLLSGAQQLDEPQLVPLQWAGSQENAVHCRWARQKGLYANVQKGKETGKDLPDFVMRLRHSRLSLKNDGGLV